MTNLVGEWQVQEEFKGDRTQKINQVATVSYLLQIRRLMLEYESMKRLQFFFEDATSKHQALVG